MQPPGILLISTPFALIGTLTSQVTGLAVARAASALASTACIPLAGSLVKYQRTLATAVAAGVPAIYPADVLSSRTLLLEQWMNLLCMLGANAAFTAGRLAAGFVVPVAPFAAAAPAAFIR